MKKAKKKSLIAIASSTGGPQALHTLIPMLPKHLGVPIVVVQHMPKGFTESLAQRLCDKAAIRVKEAEDKEELLPDCIYFAPGGKHFEVLEEGERLYAKVYDGPAVNNLKPCADVLFSSLVNTSLDFILCVVLTGMGSDGTRGIADLKESKNVYCITQEEDSCVVYGMPRAVDLSGLSDESVKLTEIAKSITKKLGD